MGANLFDVLNRMNTEHVGSLHAYFQNNIENINAGKDGWGNIRIAITTQDAQELIAGEISGKITKAVMLFVVDRAILDAVKAEAEKPAQEVEP